MQFYPPEYFDDKKNGYTAIRTAPLSSVMGAEILDVDIATITDDQFEQVKDAGDKVSLATVYNTLGAFCDAGLMQEITVDGSKSYFDTNTHEHPHFFWEDTATLSDAPAEQLQISQLPNAPDGAEIVSVDVVIRLRKKTILKP